MIAAATTAGFFGPLPYREGLVDGGLEAETLLRWDRWWEAVAGGAARTGELSATRPAWRLVARGGVFAGAPVAGCFRLGASRSGRIYPFVVLFAGAAPDPSDPFFEEAERVVRGATDGRMNLDDLWRALARCPAPAAGTPPDDAAAAIWRDDWLVQELRFAQGRDLLGFPVALAVEGLLEEDAA